MTPIELTARTLVQEGRDWVWSTPQPAPLPRTGELLVQTEALALRASNDWGADSLALELLGCEVAGSVIAVGPDTAGDWIGQRVMALVTPGAPSDYVLVAERLALPLADSLSTAVASTLPAALFAAYGALRLTARARPLQRLLLIAPCFTQRLLALMATRMGLDVYTRPPTPIDGAGFDIVVAGAPTDGHLGALREGGQLICTTQAQGASPLDLGQLHQAGLTITGFRPGERVRTCLGLARDWLPGLSDDSVHSLFVEGPDIGAPRDAERGCPCGVTATRIGSRLVLSIANG